MKIIFKKSLKITIDDQVPFQLHDASLMRFKLLGDWHWPGSFTSHCLGKADPLLSDSLPTESGLLGGALRWQRLVLFPRASKHSPHCPWLTVDGSSTCTWRVSSGRRMSCGKECKQRCPNRASTKRRCTFHPLRLGAHSQAGQMPKIEANAAWLKQGKNFTKRRVLPHYLLLVACHQNSEVECCYSEKNAVSVLPCKLRNAVLVTTHPQLPYLPHSGVGAKCVCPLSPF